MLHTRPVLLFAALAFALTLSAVPRSNRIWIEKGGLITGETSGYRFVQIIGNTSEQPLWLTVRQGAGSPACEVTAKVEPKRNGIFTCDVAELKPGKVPVVIEVYADEARTQQLESHREEMSFSKRDIRELKDLETALKLPVTYEESRTRQSSDSVQCSGISSLPTESSRSRIQQSNTPMANSR